MQATTGIELSQVKSVRLLAWQTQEVGRPFIDGHWEFEPDSKVKEGFKFVKGQWKPGRIAGFSIFLVPSAQKPGLKLLVNFP